MLKRRFQISLARWLLIVAVVGAASGMYLRSRLEQTRFVSRNRICEGFSVEGMWQRRSWGKEDTPFYMKSDRLLYLLAWPSGPRFSLSTNSPLDYPPSGQGVLSAPSGIYVDGRRVPIKPGQLVWIYSAYEGGSHGTVEPLKVTKGNIAAFSVEDFEHLEQMPCWPEIEASLIEYSKFARRQKDKMPPLIPNPGETPP